MVKLASTMPWGIAAVLACACGSEESRAPERIEPARAPAPAPIASCADAIAIWTDGRPNGTVCRTDAAAHGLTIIDLSDQWTPAALTPAAGAPPISYRATYLALAQERWSGAGADEDRARDDRYLELYGIEPTFTIVRARLADLKRHACHAAIVDLPIARMTGTVREESRDDSNRRLWKAKSLWLEVARLRKAKRLTPFALGALIDSEVRLAAIEAVQAHLVCDGLYDPHFVDGNYTWQTSTPIEQFQRGAMVLPTGWLDPDTRAAMMIGSRERDFRAALRALRERVIAATGLIEDGTAGAGMGTVAGRSLEPRTVWRAKGYAPLADAAPDLISPATDAAARALGWNDASSVLAFLETQPLGEVAIALPPPPPWHHAQMDLRVEIDRGDVWYDPVPIMHTPSRRPALTLYTIDGARKIALVRWPTTIGGWQDEKSEAGEVDEKWKESPPGPRVWHELWVAPTWIPPGGTPDKDLVRVGVDERYHLRRDVLGPGYRSAFGLSAFVHQVPIKRRGVVTYDEEGIRTHGAANLSSIATGISHGCHRLLGVDSLRLAGFVLAHRAHVARGEQATIWKRVVRYRTRELPAQVKTRGYLVEIDPPVPVMVLKGTIKSARKRPYR
ncbi:MAG TPA: peptidoglycan-binding domain-containing protein [Kofleriaceae bacterium]|nr:peptidoglycan-binding domain-containing protein [Kofleriaceae bacterium]